MIKSLPTVLFFATWALLVGAVPMLVGLFLSGTFEPDAVRAAFPHLHISQALSPMWFAVTILVGLVPWAVGLWVLYQMQALFALYRTDRALTLDAAHLIRRIGTGLLVLAITHVVTNTLQTLVLTSANADGERVLSVSFGTPQIGFIMAAGLMVVIGRSMIEAAKAVDDMRGII